MLQSSSPSVYLRWDLFFQIKRLGSKDVGQVDHPAQEAVAREEPGQHRQGVFDSNHAHFHSCSGNPKTKDCANFVKCVGAKR